MLIATVFGLTAWYAVSGYLGSYQGGKLWVAASGDAVEDLALKISQGEWSLSGHLHLRKHGIRPGRGCDDKRRKERTRIENQTCHEESMGSSSHRRGDAQTYY